MISQKIGKLILASKLGILVMISIYSISSNIARSLITVDTETPDADFEHKGEIGFNVDLSVVISTAKNICDYAGYHAWILPNIRIAEASVEQ